MFRSTITRPLLWAIPLAVVAAILAALWYLRPLTVGAGGERVPCAELYGTFVGNPCADAWQRRVLVSGLILAVGGLPLLIVVVRACVLAADTIAELREDMRRLHERLGGGS